MDFSFLKITTFIFMCVTPVITDSNTTSDGNTNTTTLSPTATTMTICSIIERGNPLLIANYDRIGPAISLALDAVHENVLPASIRFRLLYKDGGKVCAPRSSTIGRLIELTSSGVKCNLYLGPGCSEAVLDLYQAAEHENIVIMGIPGAHTSSRSGLPRWFFPNLIRTTYTFVDLGRAVNKFMDLFKYLHITIIVNTESYFYQEMGDNFRNQYRTTVQNQRKITTFVDFSHDQAPSNWTTAMLYDDLLTDANLTSRVIFLMANSTVVRNMMIRASILGMATGQHVYICVELFKSQIWGEFAWQTGDIYDRDARNAFQSLLVISMAEVLGPELDEFTRQLRVRARREFNYTFGPFERVDPVTLAYVEAIFLVANVVKQISAAGKDFTNTLTLLEKMRNITVKSRLADNITIAPNGDRVILYDIKTFDLDSYSARPVFRMDFVRSKFIPFAAWRWPDGKGGYSSNLPPDVPRCGLSGLECTESEKDLTLIITASVIPVLLLIVVAAAVAFMYRKMRWNENPYWWRYYTKDLEFPEIRRHTSSVGSSYTVTTKATAVTVRMNSISLWKLALLQGNQVFAFPMDKDVFRATEGLVSDLKLLRYMRHQNIQRFIGLCIDDHSWITHVLAEVCSKGCLQDILENLTFKLDWSFKFSFMKDIAQGLAYLHASSIHSHGFLTSVSCLVDGRFVAKVAECGLAKLRPASEREPPTPNESVDSRDFQALLWRAPEQLRIVMSEKGSQQIILRSSPFAHSNAQEFRTNRDIKDLLLEIKKGVVPPVRPPVPRSACSVELYDLMERCWSEFPMDRPSMAKVQESIRKISGLTGDNVIDLLLTRMEDYSHDLENQITEKNLLLTQERQRLDDFTNHLLPSHVAAKLSKGDVEHPQVCSAATVFSAKLVTNFHQNKPLQSTVQALNDIVDMFDHLVDMHPMAWRPLVTSGNYLVVCGLPGFRVEENNHAVEAASIAIQLRDQFRLMPSVSLEDITLQAGIHSSACVTGIIGIRPPRYCIFGDCILMSGRLKHLALPGKMIISESTRNLMPKDSDAMFRFEMRAPKIETDPITYWLDGTETVEFI